MGIITQKSLDRLYAIRRQAEIDCSTNTDEQALEVSVLYPEWGNLKEGTTLNTGERVNDLGILYNVLQTHQVQKSWSPAMTPSLFSPVLIPDSEVIPEWRQPDSTNGYSKGDKVAHKGKNWESLVDNNVWEPGVPGTETLWKESEATV